MSSYHFKVLAESFHKELVKDPEKSKISGKCLNIVCTTSEKQNMIARWENDKSFYCGNIRLDIPIAASPVGAFVCARDIYHAAVSKRLCTISREPEVNEPPETISMNHNDSVSNLGDTVYTLIAEITKLSIEYSMLRIGEWFKMLFEFTSPMSIQFLVCDDPELSKEAILALCSAIKTVKVIVPKISAEFALSSLVSLALARGEMDLILLTVDAVLNSEISRNLNIFMSRSLVELQENMKTIAYATEEPSWYKYGVPQFSKIETLQIPFDDELSFFYQVKSVASTGRYLYCTTDKYLLKIGTGFQTDSFVNICFKRELTPIEQQFAVLGYFKNLYTFVWQRTTNTKYIYKVNENTLLLEQRLDIDLTEMDVLKGSMFADNFGFGCASLNEDKLSVKYVRPESSCISEISTVLGRKITQVYGEFGGRKKTNLTKSVCRADSDVASFVAGHSVSIVMTEDKTVFRHYSMQHKNYVAPIQSHCDWNKTDIEIADFCIASHCGNNVVVATSHGMMITIKQNPSEYNSNANWIQNVDTILDIACNERLIGLIDGNGMFRLSGCDVLNSPYLHENLKDQTKIKFSKIALGDSHIVLLTETGVVYTFGKNNYGQCGHKINDEQILENYRIRYHRAQKANIPDEAVVIQISSGRNHSVALERNGVVYVFGKLLKYQLPFESIFHPLKVDFHNTFKQIAAGAYHTVLLDCVNTVYIYGGTLEHSEQSTPLPSETYSPYASLLRKLTISGIGASYRVLKIDAVADLIILNVLQTEFPADTAKLNVFSNGDDLFFSAKNHCLVIKKEDTTEYKAVAVPAFIDTAITYDWNYNIFWSVMIGVDREERRTLSMSYYDICSIETTNVERRRDLFLRQVRMPRHADFSLPARQVATHLLHMLHQLGDPESTRNVRLQFEAIKRKEMLPSVRDKELKVIHRFRDTGSPWNYDYHKDAICFTTSKDIILCGIGIYVNLSKQYVGNIELYEMLPDDKSTRFFSEILSNVSIKSRRDHPVYLFKNQIHIKANLMYTLVLFGKTCSSDYGMRGQPYVIDDSGILFRFFNSDLSGNGTNVDIGQIPLLVYKEVPPVQLTIFADRGVHSKIFFKTYTKMGIKALSMILPWSWEEFKRSWQSHHPSAECGLLQSVMLVQKSCLSLIRLHIENMLPLTGENTDECTHSLAASINDIFLTIQHMINDEFTAKNLVSGEQNSVTDLLITFVENLNCTFITCFDIFLPCAALKLNFLIKILGDDTLNSVPKEFFLKGIIGALMCSSVSIKHSFPCLTGFYPSVEEERQDSTKPCGRYFVLLDSHSTDDKVYHSVSSWNLVMSSFVNIIGYQIEGTHGSEKDDAASKTAKNVCSLIAKILLELTTFEATGDDEDADDTLVPYSTPSRFPFRSQNRFWANNDAVLKKADYISFNASNAILLTGISVYGDSGSYTYRLILMQKPDENNIIADTTSEGKTYFCSVDGVIDLYFNEPVLIQAKTKYTVGVYLSGLNTCYGLEGNTFIVGPDGTQFTFMDSEFSSSLTTCLIGQIPSLLYYSCYENPEYKLAMARSRNDHYASTTLAIAEMIISKATEVFTSAKKFDFLTLETMMRESILFNSLVPALMMNLTRVATFKPYLSSKIIELVEPLRLLLSDLNEPDSNRPPLLSRFSPRCTIVESEHPYKPAVIVQRRISYPDDVSWIYIEFDQQSVTAQVEDVLRIYIPSKIYDNADTADIFFVCEFFQSFFPRNAIMLPGNQVIFSFETATYNSENNPNNYGYKCAVFGYSDTSLFRTEILQKDLLILRTRCASALINQNIFNFNDSDEEVNAINVPFAEFELRSYPEVLGAGFQSLHANDSSSLDEYRIKEKEFMNDFIELLEDTDGGRLASWLMRLPALKPSKCEVLLPRVEFRKSSRCLMIIIPRDQYGNILKMNQSADVTFTLISSEIDHCVNNVSQHLAALLAMIDPDDDSIAMDSTPSKNIDDEKKYNLMFGECQKTEQGIVTLKQNGLNVVAWEPAEMGEYTVSVSLGGIELFSQNEFVITVSEPLPSLPEIQTTPPEPELKKLLHIFLIKNEAGSHIFKCPLMQGIHSNPTGFIKHNEIAYADDFKLIDSGVWVKLVKTCANEYCTIKTEEAWCLRFDSMNGEELLIPMYCFIFRMNSTEPFCFDSCDDEDSSLLKQQSEESDSDDNFFTTVLESSKRKKKLKKTKQKSKLKREKDQILSSVNQNITSSSIESRSNVSSVITSVLTSTVSESSASSSSRAYCGSIETSSDSVVVLDRKKEDRLFTETVEKETQAVMWCNSDSSLPQTSSSCFSSDENTQSTDDLSVSATSRDTSRGKSFPDRPECSEPSKSFSTKGTQPVPRILLLEESSDNYSLPQSAFVNPSMQKDIRMAFAAFLWHEGLQNEAIKCLLFLKGHPTVSSRALIGILDLADDIIEKPGDYNPSLDMQSTEYRIIRPQLHISSSAKNIVNEYCKTGRINENEENLQETSKQFVILWEHFKDLFAHLYKMPLLTSSCLNTEAENDMSASRYKLVETVTERLVECDLCGDSFNFPLTMHLMMHHTCGLYCSDTAYTRSGVFVYITPDSYHLPLQCGYYYDSTLPLLAFCCDCRAKHLRIRYDKTLRREDISFYEDDATQCFGSILSKNAKLALDLVGKCNVMKNNSSDHKEQKFLTADLDFNGGSEKLKIIVREFEGLFVGKPVCNYGTDCSPECIYYDFKSYMNLFDTFKILERPILKFLITKHNLNSLKSSFKESNRRAYNKELGMKVITNMLNDEKLDNVEEALWTLFSVCAQPVEFHRTDISKYGSGSRSVPNILECFPSFDLRYACQNPIAGIILTSDIQRKVNFAFQQFTRTILKIVRCLPNGPTRRMALKCMCYNFNNGHNENAITEKMKKDFCESALLTSIQCLSEILYLEADTKDDIYELKIRTAYAKHTKETRLVEIKEKDTPVDEFKKFLDIFFNEDFADNSLKRTRLHIKNERFVDECTKYETSERKCSTYVQRGAGHEMETTSVNLRYAMDIEQMLVTDIQFITDNVNIEASSNDAGKIYIINEETESYWSSDDNDELKFLKITPKCDYIIHSLHVFVDNGRDIDNKINQLKFVAWEHDYRRIVFATADLCRETAEWITFILPRRYTSITILSEGAKYFRIHGLKVKGIFLGQVGEPAVSSIDSMRTYETLCYQSAVQSYRCCVNQIFSDFFPVLEKRVQKKRVLEKRDHSANVSIEEEFQQLVNDICEFVQKDNKTCDNGEAIENTIEETNSVNFSLMATSSVVDGYTSSNIKTLNEPLSVDHECNDTQQSVVIPEKACDAVLYVLCLRTNALKKIWRDICLTANSDEYFSLYMCNESCCLALFQVLMAICKNRTIKNYFLENHKIFEVLFVLLHTGTVIIQDQVVSLLNELLPASKPYVNFGFEDTADITSYLNNKYATFNNDPNIALNILLGVISKDLSLTTANNSSVTTSKCITNGNSWYLNGKIQPKIVIKIKELLMFSLQEKSPYLLRKCIKLSVLENIVNVIELLKLGSREEILIKYPSFWLGLSSLLFLRKEDLDTLPIKIRNSESLGICVNHAESEATFDCNICGLLCSVCYESRHLGIYPDQDHSIQVCPTAENAVSIIIQENSVKLTCGACVTVFQNHKALIDSSVRMINRRAGTRFRCRFCKSECIPSDIEHYTCQQEDCQEYLKYACLNTLPCGHLCSGVISSEECMPCLYCNLTSPNQICSDVCIICYTDHLHKAPCVMLRCGHIFHYKCILNLLTAGKPTIRISFGFLKCPICKEDIYHNVYRYLTDPLYYLRDELYAKAQDIMRYDEPSLSPEKAFEKCAFYFCHFCQKPYYGGVAECDEDLDDRPLEEYRCVNCTSGANAGTCREHMEAHMHYKCRYCCSLATYFCFGTTHFCAKCHENITEHRDRKEEYPQCPVGPGGVQLYTGFCPLRIDHPPTGQEFVIGCYECQKKKFGKPNK